MKKITIFLVTAIFFFCSTCFGLGSFDEWNLSGEVKMKMINDIDGNEFFEIDNDMRRGTFELTKYINIKNLIQKLYKYDQK